MCAARAGRGRGRADVKAALPLLPRSLPAEATQREGGATRWDWRAKCKRRRGLAGEVLEGVPLSN